MDAPEREAQAKGYQDGRSHRNKQPRSEQGTRFLGHLLRAYERGYTLGKQDYERLK